MSFLQLKSQLGQFILATFPTVITNAVDTITSSSVNGNGNAPSAGGSPITERGFVYSTNPQPTTADTKVTSGSGTGTFSASLSPLSSSTTYHYRAYAINATGTSYGDDVSFVTSSSGVAVVSSFVYQTTNQFWGA